MMLRCGNSCNISNQPPKGKPCSRIRLSFSNNLQYAHTTQIPQYDSFVHIFSAQHLVLCCCCWFTFPLFFTVLLHVRHFKCMLQPSVVQISQHPNIRRSILTRCVSVCVCVLLFFHSMRTNAIVLLCLCILLFNISQYWSERCRTDYNGTKCDQC